MLSVLYYFTFFHFFPERKWKKSLSSTFFQASPVDYHKKYTFNKILAIYIVMALLSCMFILLFWIWPPGPSNIGYVCDTVFFLLRVAANVSAFVVGSNPTGICTLCKNTPGMGLFTDTLHLLL